MCTLDCESRGSQFDSESGYFKLSAVHADNFSMHSSKVKNLAISLRKQGFAYNEISAKVGIAKSTLHYWLRDIDLTDEQRSTLRLQQRQHIEKSNAQRLKNTYEVYSSTLDDIVKTPALSTTTQKGELAMLKVQLRAVEKGIILSKPTVEGTRYDVIADDGGQLSRVQIKYADGTPTKSSGTVVLGLSTNTRNRRRIFKTYQDGEVDILLVYIPKIDVICCFKPSVFIRKTSLTIRIFPSLNSQTKGCLFAVNNLW